MLKAGLFFKWTEEAVFCIRSDFYGRDLIYEKGPALFKAGPFFKWTGEAAFCTKRVRLRPGGRKENIFFDRVEIWVSMKNEVDEDNNIWRCSTM